MCLLLIHTPNESKAQFLMPLRQINEYRPPRKRKEGDNKETNPSWDCAPGGWRIKNEGAKHLVSHASNELLRHTTGSKKAATTSSRDV